MDKSKLKIDENPYCYVSSAGAGDINSARIDELLARVKRIESSLITVNNFINKQSPPPVPVKPPDSETTEITFPPPRPPRSPKFAPSTEKVFRKTDCQFFQAQLQGVRSYLDNMIDDDFDDKREHMMALESIISALKIR